METYYYWLEYEPMKFSFCVLDENGTRNSLFIKHKEYVFDEKFGSIITLVYPYTLNFWGLRDDFYYRTLPYVDVCTLDGRRLEEIENYRSQCTKVFYLEQISNILSMTGFKCFTEKKEIRRYADYYEYGYCQNYSMYFKIDSKNLPQRYSENALNDYNEHIFSNLVPNELIDKVIYYKDGIEYHNPFNEDKISEWVEITGGEYIMFVAGCGHYVAYCNKYKIFNEILYSDSKLFDVHSYCVFDEIYKRSHIMLNESYGVSQWIYDYDSSFIGKPELIYLPSYLGFKFVCQFIEDNNLCTDYNKSFLDLCRICVSQSVEELRINIANVISKSIILTINKNKRHGKSKQVKRSSSKLKVSSGIYM